MGDWDTRKASVSDEVLSWTLIAVAAIVAGYLSGAIVIWSAHP